MSLRTSDASGSLPGGKQIPFRVAIVTVVVGLLVVTCGALITYVLVRGQQSVEILKRDYLEQVADTTVRDVVRLPLTAAQVLRVQRYRIGTGYYSMGDPMGLARALAGALVGDPDIQWIGYSEHATGRFIGAHRLSKDEFILNLSDPRVNRGVPREFRTDSLEPYLRTPPLTEPYEPRTRDWYRRAAGAPAGAIVWLPPYVFTEGIQGITAAVAVRDASKQLLGVLTVDFALAGVASFVRSIKLGRGGVALFDRGGALLAGEPGPGRDAASRAVLAWTGPSTRADASAGARRAPVTVDGETWDVVARALAEPGAPEWIVTAVVPEEAFMGPLYANRRAAIVIALAGLALAAVAGALLSNNIADSVGSVTRALDRIARFEVQGLAPGRPSRLREIALLQEAVGRVTASLRSFTRYAPEEIVREVAASGREAMLSGERREVSVLFSDLRGFTAFAEELRPEEVVTILNDHFELLVGIIAKHQGFVVDFLGDAVFAVFGAPPLDPQHAEHAVACAIDMQRARAARDEEHRARGWPPMEMGVGIDTGPAVVGNMGSERRIKYGVVGHVVNAAARLETLTVGGQVLVSDTTRQALGDRLLADGPHEAEGKDLASAMHLWEVLALRGETLRIMPSPVRDLGELPRPIDAHVRLVLGKHVAPQSHAARLHRLGPGGAELESATELTVFGTIQILLRISTDGGEPDVLDGKVVSLSEREGAITAIVRFTALAWETRDRIEAVVQRERSLTTLRPGPA
jgi:class 3 adenylate cyclase